MPFKRAKRFDRPPNESAPMSWLRGPRRLSMCALAFLAVCFVGYTMSWVAEPIASSPTPKPSSGTRRGFASRALQGRNWSRPG